MDSKENIYIDVNLIFRWIELTFFSRHPQKADEEKFIKFLSEHKEIKVYISAFTAAEIAAKLSKQFGENATPELIKTIIETLINTLGAETIKYEIFFDKQGKERKGLLISQELPNMALACRDAKDAVHICLAKSNDLLFVTRDKDATRVRTIYEKVTGAEKYIKQFSS